MWNGSVGVVFYNKATKCIHTKHLCHCTLSAEISAGPHKKSANFYQNCTSSPVHKQSDFQHSLPPEEKHKSSNLNADLNFFKQRY